ncbi:MAG: gentisate 1,2-dioxygenase [Alphaproteobacteria bacterium]|jgi:gentisate 1,2-dioxygenase|nr:gentisate 1,2-dioxygenase [Alphaproteobacteria bacterium]
MSATDTRPAMTAAGDKPYEEVRKAWHAAHIRPLWESQVAHRARDGGPKPHLWQWRQLRSFVEDAIKVTTPAAVERRVLSLVDPEDNSPSAGTTTNLSAALQVLLPGEAARPHRHTMNALRFVIEGKGAHTVVDGKSCLMEEGDLVITPGWTWHEHVHKGSGPIVWMDALDAPLHRYLGTDAFQPGPVHDLPDYADDDAFAMPNIVPDVNGADRPYSPVFRYPWAQAAAAVSKAPKGKDGARRVRYVNPLTGGPAMQLIDCYLAQIDRGIETVPFRTTSNAVCCVAEGHGSSRIGDDTLTWGPKDIFSLPHGNWITHRAESERATLFLVTDRDTLKRLDLLKEQYGNDPG